MKTTEQLTWRIEIIEERLAELKAEREQNLTKASENIRECADDPMYVAIRINGWTAGITNLTERIEKLEHEIETLKWVL